MGCTNTGHEPQWSRRWLVYLGSYFMCTGEDAGSAVVGSRVPLTSSRSSWFIAFKSSMPVVMGFVGLFYQRGVLEAPLCLWIGLSPVRTLSFCFLRFEACVLHRLAS